MSSIVLPLQTVPAATLWQGVRRHAEAAEGDRLTIRVAEVGVEIPVSCEQGVCGTCLTRVLGGQPDHVDYDRTPAEPAADDQFLPCCPRAKSPCWCWTVDQVAVRFANTSLLHDH